MENKTESERESNMGKTGSKQTKLDGTEKRTYVTRKDVSYEVKENREKFLSMPLEEKRKLYKKKKFVVIDNLQTWQQQAPEIMHRFARHKLEPAKDVDDVLNNKICMWQGDITTLEIDAIVNAANGSLLGGGGVDGAIHSAAGSKLREECATLNGCDTGEAKITAGYKLPAKYVIHTVGPIGVNPEKLSSCYKRCLDIVKQDKIRTVAFPCISTGIYGYDIDEATPVVMTTVRNWLLDNQEHIDRIIFCVFLSRDIDVYQKNLLKYFPIIIKDGEKPEPSNKKAKKDAKKAEKARLKAEGTKTVNDSKSDIETDTVNLDIKSKEVCYTKTEENLDSSKREITDTDRDSKENDSQYEKLTGKGKDEKDSTASVKDAKEDALVTRSKVKQEKEKKQMTMDGFLTKGNTKENTKIENAQVQESKDSSKGEIGKNSADLNKKIATKL